MLSSYPLSHFTVTREESEKLRDELTGLQKSAKIFKEISERLERRVEELKKEIAKTRKVKE